MATPSGASGRRPPDPRRPQVWVLDTTQAWFERLADAEVVSGQERARAAALGVEENRRRLVARRSALRLILGEYLSRAPGDVGIVTAPGGKPVLLPADMPGPTFAFSVAHSGDLFCVAVGTVSSVGLDVERLRAVPRARSIASRWFAASENARLSGFADEDVDVEFMRVWTAKEALAKRHGAGLRLMSGREGELDVQGEEREGRLRVFSPATGYAAAVASAEVIDQLDFVRPEEGSWII